VDPNKEEDDTLEKQGDVLVDEGNRKIPITLKIDSVVFSKNDDGQLSNVNISIVSSKTCLTAETEAKFLALKIKDRELGRKIFAVVAMGTLLAAGDNSAYDSASSMLFLNGELRESERMNKIQTYGKETSFGESYPPKRGKNTAKRHALKNAIRLNFARYIALIGQACQ
jgi:hypothetical protein